MAGKIITFYSYKGGVGRSFLLANVAALLARWGYRVLCIDWDLEAPGLGHYFRSWITSEKPGVVDLVTDFASNRNAPNWVQFLGRVQIPSFQAKFDFISAGTGGDQYLVRAQGIDWDSLYGEHGFGEFLEGLRSTWKSLYDFVLVDSRTGISDLAGICTIHLPDLLVFLFTANNQSLEGATSSAARIVESRNQLPFDREKLLCLPVLSRFAVDKEYELANDWMLRIETSVSDFYTDWLSREVPVRSLLLSTRIPENVYWTFGERLPVVEDQPAANDPLSINQPMMNIAALLARDLSGVQQLMLSRDAYLASAEQNRRKILLNMRSSQTAPQVFLSAPFDEAEFAESLARELGERGADVQGDWKGVGKRGDNWKHDLLRELRNARYLIVLIVGKFDDRQDAAVESFFSLSVRGRDDGRIIPVLLNEESMASVPSILRSLTFVDGRDRSVETVAFKCSRIIWADSDVEPLALV
ncbi:toll/interleukin-1 receptor domain-containing protein [Zoogloea sp. LCSB751]|uniref:toll/interleukin-1 receptor domain-containing protein n=1 Tax=Zoogloea sp. LCSB751 TaxID=1965277 RepID=UPI0009A473DB|nr:toll/interleukin-1 receptor domain-containing protein [Zoogloea sp. LCSB751]